MIVMRVRIGLLPTRLSRLPATMRQGRAALCALFAYMSALWLARSCRNGKHHKVARC